MTSGGYARRACPACGAKGTLTSATLAFGPDAPPIAGSRCRKCRCESAGGRVVRRGRAAPGREEELARLAVVDLEIEDVEASVRSKMADLEELRRVAAALRAKLDAPA